jgi:hypothetical protein
MPISQSLRIFNQLAASEDRFTEKEIDYFTRERKSRRTCEAKCLTIRQVV